MTKLEKKKQNKEAWSESQNIHWTKEQKEKESCIEKYENKVRDTMHMLLNDDVLFFSLFTVFALPLTLLTSLIFLSRNIGEWKYKE